MHMHGTASVVCEIYFVLFLLGTKVIGLSGSLIWSKTLMELIFNPYYDFR